MQKTVALKLAFAALGAGLVGLAATLTVAQQPGSPLPAPAAGAARPEGPCDIYEAAKTPCAAAHSTTRALYASYNGPLYQVLRKSDGRTLNIGVVRGTAGNPGGYANAAAQDAFCANDTCWISVIYDQSPKGNHLHQAPRGAFSGQGMGGFNNLPLADAAPVTLMGHKVYGVYIAPGMGLRNNDPVGTAVDDQAQGQYWVINGHHFNSGCCFNYGNAELTSRDDGNGTMESTHYGNSTSWFHGQAPGPWIMTDQENNLVGCTNPGSDSKYCPNLPSISWRFVTAMAKGRPGVWASLGGDAQRGALQLMFEGPRVDVTYDPMRKQGAILLGNGGDNSIASQGTFYEAAMTAANTYPSHDVDQRIQANVVAARYDVPMLTVAPAAAIATPTGVQTFQPGNIQETAVRFTNTSGAAISNLRLSLAVPAGWNVVAGEGANVASVAPGASVNATFRVTAGPAPYNGDMTATASWNGGSWRAVQKLRNGPPVKINEFRIGDAGNATNSFIELYNAGGTPVDISNWSVTQHAVWLPVTSAIRIPAGTRLAPRGFYLLGLANSGLAVPARAGDSVIHVRNIDGLKAGDTIRIGNETRRITAVGTAAGPETTLWQPMPYGDRSVMTVARGATNVPVASVNGFKVGEKVALGYGTTYPAVYRDTERFEIATVTDVGKPGSYPYLALPAKPGDTNISVIGVNGTADISVGDRIRLDVDSVGHGIETVTVTQVGTPANMLALVGDTKAGATSIRVRLANLIFNNAAVNAGRGLAGLQPGVTLVVGNPGKEERVTITAVTGDTVEIKPALARDHLDAEHAIDPGTGLTIAAPLKFAHAGNLPFSNNGTGISFKPATAMARSTNEPIIPLGSGITLDRPLSQNHPINEVVRSEGVTAAGYQGPAPQQWFGGPSLSPAGGSIVLRDAAGRVADSLNYGLIVDPWAAEGYHTVSGTGQAGCRAPAAGGRGGRGAQITANSSAGRIPDGRDTDSNCNDFVTQGVTALAAAAPAGSNNLKTTGGMADFVAGQSVTIGAGGAAETATVAQVGTQGSATSGAAVAAGATVIPLAPPQGGRGGPGGGGFIAGQAVAIGTGAQRETNLVRSVQGGRGGQRMTVQQPLRFAHPAGAPVTGTGLTLTAPLARAHAAGTAVTSEAPTPGAANRYSRR
jgi:hypothetical protein